MKLPFVTPSSRASGSTPSGRLVWRADQPFLKGTQGFEVTPTAAGCQVEHVLDADLAWWFAPVWGIKVRAVHDRIVEHLFDPIEAADCADIDRLLVSQPC